MKPWEQYQTEAPATESNAPADLPPWEKFAQQTPTPEQSVGLAPTYSEGPRYDTFTEATGKAVGNVPERLQASAGGLIQALGESMSEEQQRSIELGAQKLGITPDDYKLLYVAGEQGITDEIAQSGEFPEQGTPAELAQFIRDRYMPTGDIDRQVKDASLIDPEAVGEAGLNIRRDAEADMDQVNAEPGSLAYYGSAAIGSTAEMLPALLAAAVTRNPGVAGKMIGLQVGGQAYGTARDEGMSPQDSRLYAFAQAASEAIPEQIVVSKLLEPGKSFFGKLGKAAVAESLQEGLTAVLQSGIDKGTIRPDMTWEEARQNITDGMIIGSMAGPMMTAAMEPAARLGDRMRSQGEAEPPTLAPDQVVQPEQPAPQPAPEPTPEPEAQAQPQHPADQFAQSVNSQPQETESGGLSQSGTGVYRVPTESIEVDPEAYQFRSKVNTDGVDKRLDGVTKWDDERAGTILIHRRKDGRLFVADGHHRVDLAKKLQQPGINARILDESEGVTVEQARVRAALKNIANDNGEPVDVAKVFRDSGVSADEVRSQFNLPRSQVVADGEALAKLADNVFGLVSSGQMPEKDGAAIGRYFDDPAQQEAAAKVFQQVQPDTEYKRNLLANEIRAAEFEAAQGEQGGLFGDDPGEISLMKDRLKILDSLRQELNRDKTLFKSLNTNADRASQAGNRIATDNNAEISEQSAKSLQLLERVATTPALNEKVVQATRRLADGENRKAVVADLKKELLNYERGLDSGTAGSRSGSADTGGQDARASEPVPQDDAAGADQGGQPQSSGTAPQGQVTDAPQGVESQPGIRTPGTDLLSDYSEAELKQQAEEARQKQEAEDRARREEEQRAEADEQIGGFTLTGSSRPADVAMAAGQDDMFASPQAQQPEPEPTKTDDKAPSNEGVSGSEARKTKGTAPEHWGMEPADDRTLDEIVSEFNAAIKGMVKDDFKVHHLFDPPKKKEIHRLNQKANVYHKEHGWMTPKQARAVIDSWKDHAAQQGEDSEARAYNSQKVVLSLFDLSGKWSQPWEEAGYQVFRFDIQDSEEVGDVMKFNVNFFGDYFGDFDGLDIHAVLAACPCTDFASSGNKHFKEKDKDGRTKASVELVHQTLRAIEYFKPSIWAIENPVGRIEKLGGLPPWRLSFHPHDLGENYTKKTLIWGRFNADLPIAPAEPTEGSKMHTKYGGKSQATKNARSVTPEGFAYSFFKANNAIDHPVMTIHGKYDRLDRDLIARAVEAGVTEKQIDEVVEDPYYMDMDDAAAEQAIRDLIGEPAPEPKAEPESSGTADRPGLGRLLSFAQGKIKGKPAGKDLDRVAKLLVQAKSKAGENIEARKARLQDVIATIDAHKGHTAEDLFSQYKLPELKDLAKRLSLKAVGSKKNLAGSIADFFDRIGEGFDTLNMKELTRRELAEAAERGEPIALADIEDLSGRAILGYGEIFTPLDLPVTKALGLDAVQPKGKRGEHEAVYDTAEQLSVAPIRLIEDKGLIDDPRFIDYARKVREIDNVDDGAAIVSKQFKALLPDLGLPENLHMQAGEKLFAAVRENVEKYAASRKSEQAQPEKPAKAEAKPTGSGNRIFTEAAAERARKRLKAKLGQLNSGLDPEIVIDGITLAGYHIESGARKFADYARAMLADLGENARPYLASWYEGVRRYPGFDAQGMSSTEEVDNFDYDTLAQGKPAREAEGWTSPAVAERVDQMLEELAEFHAQPGYGSADWTDAPPGSRAAASSANPANKRARKILREKYHGGRPFPLTVEQEAELIASFKGEYNRIADRFKLKAGTTRRQIADAIMAAPMRVEAYGDGKYDSDTRILFGGGFDGYHVRVGIPHVIESTIQIVHTPTGKVVARPIGVEPAVRKLSEIFYDVQRGIDPLKAGESVTDEEQDGQADSTGDQPDTPAAAGSGSGRGNDAQPRPASGDPDGLGAGQSENVGEPATGESGGRSGVRGSAADVSGAGSTGEVGDSAPRSEADSGAGGADDAAGGKRKPESVSPANTGPGNFHIDDPKEIAGGGAVARFKKNQAAIETFIKVRDAGRPATAEEQRIIAGYTGWGSFGQELFQGSWNNPQPKAGWEARDKWLRDHLGETEWKGLQRSIINAHYTDPPTVQTMWAMLQRMGFKGGRVLEPSMGIGNFFGLMPLNLKNRSQLAGIELDPVTGGMAQLLYPDANIKVMGYQDSKTPDDFYDVVIGNWPFENSPIADRRYNKLNPFVHDYFFLKALDQVRPGGIVMAITSAGSMDKKNPQIRRELAKKGELLTAFRLPSGAFKDYAGTSVVTDVIVLRKRPEAIVDTSGEGWIGTVEVDTPAGEKITINEFYANNPKNVLGRLNFGNGSTYGRPSMIVERPKDLEAQLARMVEWAPVDGYRKSTRAETIRYITNHTDDREGALTLKDGKLYIVRGEYLAPAEDVVKYAIKDKAKTAAREQELRDIIELRKLYAELLDAELRDDNPEKARAALKKAYDAFTKTGPLRESYALKYLDKVRDPFFHSLAALENEENGKYVPARILTESTMRKKPPIENPSISDAFIMARAANVNPSMEEVAELANVTPEQAREELLKAGAIFELPGGDTEPSDVYLSGNVRVKYRQAKAALDEGNTAMERNLAALKDAMPETVPYYNIETQFGATWVPTAVYEQFVAHMLNQKTTTGINVAFTNGLWKVRLEPGLNNKPEASSGFGTKHYPFSSLVNAAIGNQIVTIKKKIIDIDGTKREVKDEKATEEVNGKIRDMREQFGDWLWSDQTRRAALEDEYNEVRNAYASPKYDGSFMPFDGMALQLGDNDFNLRKHQVNAIWRGIVTRKSLNAHEVGTGKSFTIAGIAVESRRYGIARKPLILGHNANSKSLAADITAMYPGARVLYIDNLSPATIDTKLRQIANDDWDAVVIPHSLIGRMSFKEETLMAMAQEEIDGLEAEARLAAEEQGVKFTDEMLNDEDELKKLRSPTAKDLVKARNRIIESIKKQGQQSSRPGAVSFEDLGIDMVLVDEAHEFKKPPIRTKMRMKGLQTGTSDKSIALKFMTDYVRANNAGGNVHLFTGTPITNTLTEVFHQMRYIMGEEMKETGVDQWDGWFGSFAKEVDDVELDGAGNYETVTRLRGFVNVPELRKMIGQYMDVVFATEMPEMRPRKTASGKTMADELTEAEREELLNGYTPGASDRPYKQVITDNADLTDDQQRVFNYVRKLAKEFKEADGKTRVEWQKSGDPHSPIIYEGIANRASFDVRLVRDEELAGQEGKVPDDPNSKISRAIRNIMEIYNSDPKANQVVFTDIGLGTTAERTARDASGDRVVDSDGKAVKKRVKVFSSMRDMVERLVQQGIPREQIAIVDGSTSKDKRKAIADAMNAGSIRVVIGSSSSLGVGVNMQRNLRAMHHLDAPYMPGDLEQRNGRGHRQGNQWNTVKEIRYTTDKLDGRRWQILAIKQKFILDFLRADANTRVIEGEAAADEQSDILETFSEAAGDPRVLLKVKLEKDLEQLRKRERMFYAGLRDGQQQIQQLNAELDNLRDRLERAERLDVVGKADAALQPGREGKFKVQVGTQTFKNRDDAQEAIFKLVKKEVDPRDSDVKIGALGDVVILADGNYSDDLLTLAIEIEGMRFEVRTPSVRGIEAALRGLEDKLNEYRETIADKESTLERLRSDQGQPFPRAEKLEQVQQAVADLEKDMAENPEPPPSWLRQGAPIDTPIFVDGKEMLVTGHRWNDRGWFVMAEGKDGKAVEVPYMQAKDEQGMEIYMERKFFQPEVSTKKKGDKPKAGTDGEKPRLRLGRGATMAGIGREKAQRIIDKLTRKWNNAPEIVVVDRVSELPAGLRQYIEAEGAEGDVEAALYRGRVYIVASRMPNRRELERTILHEVVGHYGMRSLAGKRLNPLLNEVFRKFGDSPMARDIIERYFTAEPFDRGNSEHRRMVADELMAHLAETGEHASIWQRFVEIVRDVLRKLGFTIPVNKTDLLTLLRKAQATVANGGLQRGAVTQERGAAFSRAGEIGDLFADPVDDDVPVLTDTVPTLTNTVDPGLTREQWRELNKVSQRQKRVPEVQQAVKDLRDGKISQQEYLDTVHRAQPILPLESVPTLPTLQEISFALDESKVKTGIVGLDKTLKNGERVALRLDIPAYDFYDTWVVSIHDGRVKNGKSLGYAQTGRIKNVEFRGMPKATMKIAAGDSAKAPIARMHGQWVQHDPQALAEEAERLLRSGEWIQVGNNPFRFSWFYDKADGMPLASAEEVVQVGPLVLARGVTKISPKDDSFRIAKDSDIRFSRGNGENRDSLPTMEVKESTYEQYLQYAEAPLPEVEEADYEEAEAIRREYGQGPDGQIGGSTLTGRPVSQAWERHTTIRDGLGQPAPIFRGSQAGLTPQDFDPSRFGKATNRPSAALGVFFTNSRQDASTYGTAERFYLDIRNPFVIDGPDLPDFDSPEQATRYRNAIRQQGYDGILIDYTSIGGQQHIIPFDTEQVIVPEGGPTMRRGRGRSRDLTSRSNQVKFWDGFLTQPVDRMFRMVFDATGTLDSIGRVKAGVKLTEWTEKQIKTWRPHPEGTFRWLDAPLEYVRQGVIDRYKLDDEYITLDRQSQAYARQIDMQALDILETLRERGVDGAEAEVLQELLTGGEVPDSRLNALAPEIVRAIDDLGQQAVEYGLITREAFERNRGKYLHRSYVKYEGEFTKLGKFVHNLQRNRNRAIQGDASKGRGIKRMAKTADLMRQLPPSWFGVKKEGDKPDLKLLHGRRFVVLENPGIVTDNVIPLLDDAVPPADQRELRRQRKKRAGKAIYWPADKPVPAKYQAWHNRGTFEVRRAKGDKVELWRDYTKQERQNMGEILDARYNIAKTFQVMSRDLAKGKFFQDIAQNPQWFRKDEPTIGEVMPDEKMHPGRNPRLHELMGYDWVRVPDTTIGGTAGTRRWGALAGGYVRTEIYRDLLELDKMQQGGMWRTALTQWKLNKTARSPVVHMNNVMSNFALMDLADVRVPDLIRGIRAYAKQDDDWRSALENGAFEGTYVSEEIQRNVLQPVLDQIVKEHRDADPGPQTAIKVLTDLSHKLWLGLKKADRAMTDFYQIEDEIFRMATYMRRLELGETPAEAARQANEQFLNYDIRAPAINALRRTVLPFISYTYRAVPKITESVLHRPWKLAKYATIAYLLNELAYELAPGDEDEERRTMREDQQGATWFFTDRMVRLPAYDDYGNPLFLDIRRWIPAGDVFDFNQGQSGIPVPAPLQMGGPIALAFEFALNKQAFTGEEISGETDTLGEATMKHIDWLYKSWMPSAAYLPGSHYWDKAWTAYEGGRDPLGRPYSVATALLSSVGIKAQPHDVKLGYQYRSMDLDQQAREISADMRRAQRDLQRGLIDRETFYEIQQSSREKMDRLVEKAQRLSGR